MVDTLRNLSDARALIPDNATNLVSPQDVREYLLTLEPDRGGYSWLGAGTPVQLTLVQGVWAEINATTIPGATPLINPVRWDNDAQARPFPSWGPDVTVPPGLFRAAYSTFVLSCDPDANNDDVFEIGISIGGVVWGIEQFLISENTTIVTTTAVTIAKLLQDGTEYVAGVVRNVTASRDLDVYAFGLLAEGNAYEEDPL